MPISPSQLPPLDVRTVLRRFGLHPDRRLGQNFLEDPSALESITRTAGIGPEDTVLEIGPGLGSLTRHLAMIAGKVVAVEIDTQLLPALRSALSSFQNVEIVQGDVLKIRLPNIIHTPGYLVAANIPYYITSAIIRHLLEFEPRPRRIILTIQKEVAERICAAPGDLSLLALSVQLFGQPEIKMIVPAAAFYPVPDVDSAVLSVDIHKVPAISPALIPTFFMLAKAGFAQKRKTLRNSLAGGLHISPVGTEALLRQAGIDPMRRAETLNFTEWESLSQAWSDR